jgi:hypothetical protein
MLRERVPAMSHAQHGLFATSSQTAGVSGSRDTRLQENLESIFSDKLANRFEPFRSNPNQWQNVNQEMPFGTFGQWNKWNGELGVSFSQSKQTSN